MRKADYSKLTRKIYMYMCITMVMTAGLVYLMFTLSRGIFADWFVLFLQNTFHLGFVDAQRIYFVLFRNNLEIFIIIIVVVFTLILSRFMLSQFMNYFNEINDGIDVLIKGEVNEIELSPEMDSIEDKLNILKQTLVKREQDVKSAEQRKNDMVMYLAHDIKTPLTSVIGYLNLLDEAPDMPMEQKAKYVHITLEKAYRLERLIDEFFEITRYNFQAVALSKEKIDLYYMLVQMADEFYPLLSAKGKQITLHVSEDLTVYGDPDKLARVFNNILKNAVAYSTDDSIIDITSTVSGDMVSIVFKNHGSIPKDKLGSIFDKFYRLDSARSSDSGGAGLGLAIAKEIVAEHEGSIYAESDHEYITFTVELPAS